jgi:hypothetical protein
VVFHRTERRWTRYYQRPNEGGAFWHLTGFPDKALLLSGGFRCGIALLHDGVADCTTGFGTFSGEVFVASPADAYALSGDRVYSYAGALSYWTDFAGPLVLSTAHKFSGRQLWANDAAIAAVTYTGDVVISDGGRKFREIGVLPPGAPQGTYSHPVIRGFGDDDLWVGVQRGNLYSYNGADWTERAKLVDACGSGVSGMWGESGVLYIHTDHALARWDGNGLEVLHEFPCNVTIWAVWGTSLSEVYVAATDAGVASSACGEAQVFEWTGTATHLIRL